VIADGMSEDGTRDVIRGFAASHPDLSIELVDHPRRHIPGALNRAIERATGEIVIRLDAHSVPAPDYVSRCVDALRRTHAGNVGGIWEIRPGGSGLIARGIAAAGANPFGAGDARYRISGPEGPVDTVPFGAYPRAWLERLGGFDESLHSNEDYELNYRLRKAGGTIWFDPKIQSAYRARRTLGELGRQYLRYGFWKSRMLRKHPESLRWRQGLPAVLVLSLFGLALIATLSAAGRSLLGVEFVAYVALLVFAGVLEAFRRHEVGLVIGVGAALAVMHIMWGVGFWAGWVGGWPRHDPES
jgi:cellulose synthase/poly-beta-1,6-N-acetylglucosamine synthase-like glycosyltransferase